MHIEYLISRILQLYQNLVQYHNVLSNLIDTFTYIYRVSRFNRYRLQYTSFDKVFQMEHSLFRAEHLVMVTSLIQIVIIFANNNVNVNLLM